jgi:ribosomal protein L22
MKIIHTSTFTIIHTNFNHYLETTQRKQREIIIRRKESVSHKEDTIYEYIYYIKKSLKIIFFSFLDKKLLSKYSINADKKTGSSFDIIQIKRFG